MATFENNKVCRWKDISQKVISIYCDIASERCCHQADFHCIFVMKCWLSYQWFYLWRTDGSRSEGRQPAAPNQDLTEDKKNG